MSKMTISSPAFADQEMIPQRYTKAGENLNPPLTIKNVPEGTKSLSLIVEDPDAPMGLWVHWLLWNIPHSTREIGENTVPQEAVVGKNDWRSNSYGGPAPPYGTHRYVFRLFALDNTLQLVGTADRHQLLDAMEGHVIEEATLTGTYTRH